MSELRMKPQNLEMHEAVRFGQEYTYHSDHPMKQMLSPRYFMADWKRLRRGDQIKVIRTIKEGSTEIMVEYAEVMVIDPNINGVHLLVLKGPINLPEALREQMAPKVGDPELYSDGTWQAVSKGPVHKWWVLDGNGNPLVKNVIEETAKAIARGDEPLPAPAKAA